MATKPPKLKKCKAKGCENKFTPFSSMEQWCSSACGYALSQEKLAQKEKSEKLANKKKRIAAKKAFKESDRPLQVKLTQAVVNKYVVYVQEKHKPCYTCGKKFNGNKLGGVIDCGHWLTRGAHPEKARDVRHMRRQCIPCNRYNGGRPDIFEANLIKELGQDVVDDIRSYKPPKATCADLIELRKHYAKLNKEAGL